VLFEQRGNVKLVLFYCYSLVAVPVKNSKYGSLILSLQVLVDYCVLNYGVTKDYEEVGQKDRKSADEEHHIFRNDCISKEIYSKVADVA